MNCIIHTSRCSAFFCCLCDLFCCKRYCRQQTRPYLFSYTSQQIVFTMNRPISKCGSRLRRRSARERLIEQLCQPSHWHLHPAFPLNCPHCEMSFVHQIHFNAHIRIHQPHNEVRCEECDGIFENILSLQNHMELEHSSQRAFHVSFSISQRISCGPPASSAADGEHVVIPPLNMRLYETPLPQDFASKAVFDSSPTSSSQYSSSSSDTIETPPRRKSLRPLSTLEKLLLEGTPVKPTPTVTPPIIVEQAAEELIDVMSTSPAEDQMSDSSRATTQSEQEFPMHLRNPKMNLLPPTFTQDSAATNNFKKLQPPAANPSDIRSLLMEKDISCEHCGKKFLYKCNLARHLSAIHNERTLKLNGVSSGKSPRSPFKVGPMEAIPTEKKELVLLKCDFCDRSFSQKSSLVLHRRSH